MKSAMKTFVQSCSICQQAKPERLRYPGLLQPLPVPETAWEMVSLDFVEGLPKSGQFNCILVVVDKFSKLAHFVPLRHLFTAVVVAKAYMDNVYKLHGMPSSLISDRDQIFLSNFWRELFGLAGVALRMSSAYHPQTDGQTERANQCMETFLRCFVHAVPTRWSSWLSLAEFWYNTTEHSALVRSPFQVLYGHSPRHFGIDSASVLVNPNVSSWLQEREVMQSLVKQHLHRAQDRMKRQADKGRSERQFKVGDMVFLKLQPYVQSSLAPRSNQKLAFKFFGPYKVVQRIGSVAYKLDLPVGSTVHPVFQVSQLRQAKGDQEVSPSLPIDSGPFHVPVRILHHRMTGGDRPALQGLVQWSGMYEALATWENLNVLRGHFPMASTWGQVDSQEGNVSSAGTSDHKISKPTDGPRPKRATKPNKLVCGPEWCE
jgi:hypothetical protein